VSYTTNLRQTVDLLEALPAMPKIAHEILSLQMATDNSNEILLKLIEKDPAISARIVGLSNSPLFGTSRKIMSIHDAAAVLGINRIKMIAMSFAMVSSMSSNRGAWPLHWQWMNSPVQCLKKSDPPMKKFILPDYCTILAFWYCNILIRI
jgi:HD-like signal output (HDOD) protein